MKIYWIVGYLALFLSTFAQATDIEVQALFSGKAVMLIDGEREILAIGETKRGVTLVSANADSTVLEIAGERKSYPLGSRITTQFSEVKYVEKVLFADEYGMFETIGSINGQTIDFLVDTGATLIAMNQNEAKRLGIQYRTQGEPTTASTASGTAKAYRVRLREVRLGNIVRRNVEALVLEGNSPQEVLLGMSFLGGLKVETSGNKMRIRQ